MGTTLNDTAFKELIDGNIEWLMKQEQSLERGHIIGCLKWLQWERESGNLESEDGSCPQQEKEK